MSRGDASSFRPRFSRCSIRHPRRLCCFHERAPVRHLFIHPSITTRSFTMSLTYGTGGATAALGVVALCMSSRATAAGSR
jgi:hypothetical protein